MKAFVLVAALAAALLLATTDVAAAKHRHAGSSSGGRVSNLYSQEQQQQQDSDYEESSRQGIEAIQGPLGPGTEYCFRYNGQIASGYSPQISSQRSMLRLRCVACVNMIDQGKGVLRIKNIVSGQRNIAAVPSQQQQQSEEGDDSSLKIQPMETFDLADGGDKEKITEKLELPAVFAYDRGLISNIQFHQDEQLWSKNLKKSLLNMLQLNVNSADWDKETSTTTTAAMEEDQDEQRGGGGGRHMSHFLTRSYLTMEDWIEGTCQTTYTILRVPASEYDATPETVNVTKSIDFERCTNLRDIAYGYQVEPLLQKKYLDSPHLYKEDSAAAQQPKNTGSVIPKEKLDRSTTIRFVLSKNAAGKKQSGKFGIKGVELISKYVMKSSSAEASQAMQTVALAELVLVSAKDRHNSETANFDGSKSRAESLVYNADMEYLEKVFFMRGDETNADVFKVWKKNQKVEVEKAVKHLRKLVSVFGEQNKKNGGIDSMESSELLIRLVKIMRMSTVEELKQIEEQTQQSFENGRQHGSMSKEVQQEIAADLFANALVVAATRNTIYRMNEMIKSQSKYISEATTIQLLKVLGRGAGLPAPSDAQVDIILDLCQSDTTQKSPALKQSCWLTFGTMVGELAQQTRRAKALGITETPMKQYEICPQGKMDRYKEVLIENLGSAKNLYEKILAIKCLGNAGLVSTVPQLKEIFVNTAESPIVRINAIDALRRLNNHISSEAIQSLVMPIYADVNEDSEVRMAALSMIMHTRPSKAMADQIGLIMANEKSSEVQSLVYSHMKAMSESPVPADKKTADYLKSALNLAGVDDEQFEQKHAFGSSQRGRHAFYSQKYQEGVFVDWAKIYSESSLSELPSHIAFGLDTFFNGQFNRDTLKLSLCQKNMDQIVRKIFGTKGKDLEVEQQEQTEEEEQEDEEPGFFKRAANQLKSIFGKLNIKDRNEQKQSEKPVKTGPHMFATFRLNNVDMAMVPLSAASSKNPSSAAQLAQKARQVFASLFLHSDKTSFAINIAVVLNARVSSVPTSLGVALRMKQSMYVIGQMKASTQIVPGGKLEVKAHPNLNWIQMQKMEAQAMSFFSGVKSIRTVELNLPLDMTLQKQHKKSGSSSSSSNINEEFKVTLKVPQKRVQVFGVHTIAATFLRGRNEFKDTAAANDTSKSHYHRITTIENRQLQFQQREINEVVGRESFLGIPLNIKGNYQKPRQIFSLEEIMKVLMAGDTNIHVDFYPEQTDRREIQLAFNANLYQPSRTSPAASLKPRIQDFYSTVAQGEGYSTMAGSSSGSRVQQRDEEEEEEDYNNADSASDSDSVQMAKQQQKKLNRYLEKFGNSQRTNYKHSVGASVEVVGGGGRPRQASVQLDSLCDTRLRACEGSLKVKRSPVGKSELSDWKLEGQFETLYPEYVSDANELLEASEGDDNKKRQQKFFSHIKLEWNNEGSQQQQKHSIEANIEGEPSQRMMNQILGRIREQASSSSSSAVTRRSQVMTTPRNTPFLDKYMMVTQYNLHPDTVDIFSSVLDFIKLHYFWNSRSKLVDTRSGGARGGLQIRGGVESGQMSVSAQIDAVTRQHVNFTIFTPSQQVFITNMEWPHRIQPMKLIRPSFAQSQSSNILTNLISKGKRTQCRVGQNTVDTFDRVALKAPLSTCYTVLAKDCAHKEHPKFAVLMKSVESGSEQKKLKIITRQKIVEIEPQGERQMRIKLNDEETFTVENGQVSRQSDEEKLRQEGIEIETDYQDRQAVIVDLGKLSVKFNGRQAKIQLADDYKNVQCGLCGNFNEDSSDELRKGDDQLTSDVHDFHRSYTIQDEECDQKEHSAFYRPENKHQFGEYSSQEEREVQPIARTMVMEYNHKLCFSKTPVKQCPQGYTSADDDEVDTKLLKRVKVTFSCIDRHSIEAKRIKNEIRRNGETSSLSDYSPSFIEPVVVPQRCVAF